jgi:chromosome segregation ATPase
VHPALGSATDSPSVDRIVEVVVGERIEALAGWIQELDARVQATHAAGDESTLKELRRALEAWSKRDPKLEERLTNRVDVLADRLATLSAAVNTTTAAHAGSDGEIASLRRELEQGTARIEAVVADLQQASVATEVDELRREVATLSAEQPDRKSDKRVEGLSEKVENLAARVDMLAKTIATTAAGLAGRDGDLAALRRTLESSNARVEAMVANLRLDVDRPDVGRIEAQLESLTEKLATATVGIAGRDNEVKALRAGLEQEDAKVQALVGELRQSTGVLSSQLAALAERGSDTEAVEALARRVETLASSIADLAARIESVATNVESTAAGLSTRDTQVGALQGRLEEMGSRIDAVATEARQVVAALPEPIPVAAEVDARLRPVVAQVAALTQRLVEAETGSSGRDAELGPLVADAVQRLSEIESARDAITKEIALASRAWTEERTWVREQLAALVNAVADARSAAGPHPRLEELAKQLEAIELNSERIAAEAADAGSEWTAERDALQAQLNELARAVAQATPPRATGELPADLAERLAALERGGTLVMSEISRVQAFWASQMETFEARVAQIASGTAAGGAASVELPDEQVDRLQAQLDGMRMRLASTEKELATRSAPRDGAARLDELTSRLNALEAIGLARPASSTSLVGDGRFRVEVRALELRLEHAEVTARESREAILVQLERLAERIESRFQRLEVDEPDAGHVEPPVLPELGQVVPIRSGAET